MFKQCVWCFNYSRVVLNEIFQMIKDQAAAFGLPADVHVRLKFLLS